jgi:hypothetical protein
MNKNIHIIPTDKPSVLMMEDGKLLYSKNFGFNEFNENKNFKHINKQNIYITSEEKIEEGDWYLVSNKVEQCSCKEEANDLTDACKKIILTTDPNLIASGVQPIEDDFLQWFVKNPSCEFVKIESFCKYGDNCPSKGAYDKQDLCDVGYKIIIPREEPSFQDSIENSLNIMSIASSMFGKKEEPKQDNKTVCECKRAYTNPLSGICSLCWNEKFPNEKDEIKEDDLLEPKHNSKFIVFTLQDSEDWVQHSIPLDSFEKADEFCQQFRDRKMSYLICQTLKQGYDGK